MDILVACEESQRVTIELRALGHNAYSCDILECSGGHKEWHIMQDVTPLLKGHCSFETMDGVLHTLSKKWDMIIAFPPCTYLTASGNRWFNVEKYGESALKRLKERELAVKFFKTIANANCDKIAIENPVGYMNNHFKKPQQIIHPFYFAESEDDFENYHKKRTCLWLKNLPTLERTSFLKDPTPIYVDKVSGTKRYYTDAITRNSKDGKTLRSRTFKGVAKAMAEQWTK